MQFISLGKRSLIGLIGDAHLNFCNAHQSNINYGNSIMIGDQFLFNIATKIIQL